MENDKKLQVVTQQRKKECLESALFELGLDSPFYASMLQELNISYNMMVPTAGIYYDKKREEFNIALNPYYFTSLEKKERAAILFHEILHFSHKHLLRAPKELTQDQQKLHNIAMDMAINQMIKNLPEGAVRVKDFKFKDTNGNTHPYPVFRTYEEYHQLLEMDVEQQKDGDDGDQGEGNKFGKMRIKAGSPNKDVLEGYAPMDSHDLWEGMTEEEKQDMMKEMAKVVQRTVEKSSYGHTIVPDNIKDLLEELNNRIKGIDYKRILKEAIKKTVAVQDRKPTWKRPNKRYGVYAPGTKTGDLPHVTILIDSSGSISYNELDEGLKLVDGFLKVGAKKCTLGFWHTEMYHTEKFKYKQGLVKDNLQSGGTDINCVMEYIEKTKPDLTIVFTDGCYSQSPLTAKGNQIIWIITSGGDENHPQKHVGKTLKLENLLKT